MSEKSEGNEFCCGSDIYEIRVESHLQDKWMEWFEGLALARDDDGKTTLSGSLPDQTALHSVLLKIRNMNLKLISVRLIEKGDDVQPKSKY